AAETAEAPAAAAASKSWNQSPRSYELPADGGFDVDLPAVVEPDLAAGRADDLDVPDFLK
ncbi:cell division protein FtsZ, partial [Arthrobacter crystallopoietes BAB-32]